MRPDRAAASELLPLQVLARRLRLAGDFDFDRIARMTPGFVGADLAALTKEAAATAVTRIFATLEGDPGSDAAPEQLQAAATAEEDGLVAPAEQPAAGGSTEAALVAAALGAPALDMGVGQPLSAAQLAGLAITAADFEAAVGKVQPSVRREGFATTPDVTWDDVGSLAEACARLLGGTCMHGSQRRQHRPVQPRQETLSEAGPCSGARGAGVCNHAAHPAARAICSAGHGGARGRAAVRPARLRQDAGRQGSRQRERRQLHLHQGARTLHRASSSSILITLRQRQPWLLHAAVS